LITWDILNFCKENDILTGIARGSAGGCLIAYILDIVQIDPLEYGLLFERFLNEGRMGFKTVNYTELKESNSNSGFEVCLENGVKLLLDEQSKVIVERDSEKIEISVSELQENDEIIL
jgi:DNA polymerase-3 subunit alpha